MNKSKYSKYFFSLLLLAFVVFLGFKVIRGFSSLNEAFANNLPTTQVLSKEDSLLIISKYRNKIVVNEVRNSKLRHPVSLLTYENEYSLIVHQLDMAKASSFRGFLTKENKSVDRSVGEPYNIIDNNAFQFQYRAKRN